MRHETIRRSVLGRSGYKLFLILQLKEVEDTRTISHDFEVGILHR